jgi:hypothetical protein
VQRRPVNNIGSNWVAVHRFNLLCWCHKSSKCKIGLTSGSSGRQTAPPLTLGVRYKKIRR